MKDSNSVRFWVRAIARDPRRLSWVMRLSAWNLTRREIADNHLEVAQDFVAVSWEEGVLRCWERSAEGPPAETGEKDVTASLMDLEEGHVPGAWGWVAVAHFLGHLLRVGAGGSSSRLALSSHGGGPASLLAKSSASS